MLPIVILKVGKLVRSDEEMLFVFDLKSPEIFVRKEVDSKIRRAGTVWKLLKKIRKKNKALKFNC